MGTAVTRYIDNILRAAGSIFEGLAVTLSWMFRRPMTIQYPDKIEKPIEEMLPERYRGILEVDLNYCIACLSCMRTCPIGCIRIEVGKHPQAGTRMLTRFDIDIGKCMYCGLCVEVCPTGCLHHTRLFEGTNAWYENLVLRFLDAPREPFKLQKGVESYPVDRSGAIGRSRLKGFCDSPPAEFAEPQGKELGA